MTHNINEVTTAAAETGKAAVTMLDASSQLTKEAESLRMLIDIFLGKLRDA